MTTRRSGTRPRRAPRPPRHEAQAEQRSSSTRERADDDVRLGDDARPSPPQFNGRSDPYDRESTEIVLSRAARQVKANAASPKTKDGNGKGPWGKTTLTITLGHNGHAKGATIPAPFEGKPSGKCAIQRSVTSRFPPWSGPIRLSIGRSRSINRSSYESGTLADMASYDFDLIVLGAGPAGKKGRRRRRISASASRSWSARTSLAALRFTPARSPRRTLRETALFLSGYRQSELYGLTVNVNPALAVPKLLSRKNAVRELEVARIKWNLERHGVEQLKGMARFVDAHTVEIVALGAPPRKAHQRILPDRDRLEAVQTLEHPVRRRGHRRLGHGAPIDRLPRRWSSSAPA